MCASIVSVILVSVLYYAAILGGTTQGFQRQGGLPKTITISLNVRTEYNTGTDNDLFNPVTNPSGRFYRIMFDGLDSLYEDYKLDLDYVRNPLVSFYLKINGEIKEIGYRNNTYDFGFYSYKSLRNDTFTFPIYDGIMPSWNYLSSPHNNNITLQTPIEAYINFTYTEA